MIRSGLCASDNLSDPEKAVAGAGHSALGELVYGEHYMRVMREYIKEHRLELTGRRVTVKAPRGEVSKVAGQKKINKQRLMREYGAVDVRVAEDDGLNKYSVKIELL